MKIQHNIYWIWQFEINSLDYSMWSLEVHCSKSTYISLMITGFSQASSYWSSLRKKNNIMQFCGFIPVLSNTVSWLLAKGISKESHNSLCSTSVLCFTEPPLKESFKNLPEEHNCRDQKLKTIDFYGTPLIFNPFFLILGYISMYISLLSICIFTVYIGAAKCFIWLFIRN